MHWLVPMPLGFFPLDQRSNQLREGILRQEAEALAARQPTRLLIFADSQEYLVAHILSRDRQLRIRTDEAGGIPVLLLEVPASKLHW